MASLNDIVDLSITSNTVTVSRTGFGVPVIMTYHTRFADSYVSFSSTAEMEASPYLFVATDDAHRIATSVFTQDPTCDSVIVGRLTAAPTFVTKLTMTNATEGAIVKATVLDSAGVATALSYTVLAAATTTTVATAFELLTEAVTGVNSTASTNTVLVTPNTAGHKVHIYGLQNCTIEETTADAAYDTELTALRILNDDWYAILTDTCSDANVAKIAAWALANKKLYFVSTSASKDLTSGGVAANALDALSNNRTIMLYAKNTHEYADAAWAGVGLPQDPGSINWAYKTLLGVTSGSLTSAQEGFLEGDNMNHYQPLAGLSGTRWGTVTTGEYIDIIHGTDALEARIKEDIYAVLMANPKVPYTDAGLVLIYNALLAALKAFEGTDNEPGLLARGSSVVIMPLVSSISSAVKATRVLTGVRFSATYEGAVNSVGITGTVSF